MGQGWGEFSVRRVPGATERWIAEAQWWHAGGAQVVRVRGEGPTADAAVDEALQALDEAAASMARVLGKVASAASGGRLFHDDGATTPEGYEG